MLPICSDVLKRVSPPEARERERSVRWVQLDQGLDDHDHLISPEERLHLAISRQ